MNQDAPKNPQLDAQVAELAGWKPGRANVGPNHEQVDGWWNPISGHFELSVPKFSESLDAMRVAEQRRLTELIEARYWLCLLSEELPVTYVDRRGHKTTELVGHWNATAEQHVRAYVKALTPKA